MLVLHATPFGEGVACETIACCLVPAVFFTQVFFYRPEPARPCVGVHIRAVAIRFEVVNLLARASQTSPAQRVMNT